MSGKNPNALVALVQEQKIAEEQQNSPQFAQECAEMVDKRDHIKHFTDECVELLSLSSDCRYGLEVNSLIKLVNWLMLLFCEQHFLLYKYSKLTSR